MLGTFLRDVIADAVPDGEAGSVCPLVIRGSISSKSVTHLKKKAVPPGLAFVLAKKQIERCWLTSDGSYRLTDLSQHSISAIVLSNDDDILIPRCAKSFVSLYIPFDYLKPSNKNNFEGYSSFFNLQDRALFGIAEAIIFHLTAGKTKDKGIADHLISGFLTAAFRMGNCKVDRRAAQDRIHLTFRRLADIDHYIKTNLSRSIRVSELSRIAGYSQFHFMRAMKLQTGYSPHQYILKHRIEKARSLIAEHENKLADIAVEVGFYNQAHFTTAFHRITGLTPGAFRRLFVDQLQSAAGSNPPHLFPDLVLAAQLGFDRQSIRVPAD